MLYKLIIRNTLLIVLFLILYYAGKIMYMDIYFSIAHVQLIYILYPLSIIFGASAMIGLTLGNIFSSLCTEFTCMNTIQTIITSMLAIYSGGELVPKT